MRPSLWLFALTAVATETACVKPVNTVPAPVPPTAQVQYYDLELPADLEIKAVDFTATTYRRPVQIIRFVPGTDPARP
jgi:hypothetical protein